VVNIEEKLIATVAQQLKTDVKNISVNTDIINDLGVDSLDAVELAIKIEEIFDIRFDDAQIEKFSKIKDIIDFIRLLQSSKYVLHFDSFLWKVQKN
jgi:acyl carrier protein